MAEESEDIDAVCYCDEDHTSVSDALAVEFHLMRVAFLVCSSEKPYEYRKLFICALCGSPDVQPESVFAHRHLWIYVPFLCVEGIGILSRYCLHGDGSELVAAAYTFPVLYGLGSAPAVLSGCIRGIRYALVYGDTGVASGISLNKAV